MRLMGFRGVCEKRMLLQRSKNAAADITVIHFEEITCQGLQRHPFH
jgi:hypothetical protein